jgi:hypothetical protein
MEANLPNIFSEDSAARDTAFSVVTEILQHSPGVDVSSARKEEITFSLTLPRN